MFKKSDAPVSKSLLELNEYPPSEIRKSDLVQQEYEGQRSEEDENIEFVQLQQQQQEYPINQEAQSLNQKQAYWGQRDEDHRMFSFEEEGDGEFVQLAHKEYP
jgi:hypothetical protein